MTCVLLVLLNNLMSINSYLVTVTAWIKIHVKMEIVTSTG
jgi:hypothetical protein